MRWLRRAGASFFFFLSGVAARFAMMLSALAARLDGRDHGKKDWHL